MRSGTRTIRGATLNAAAGLVAVSGKDRSSRKLPCNVSLVYRPGTGFACANRGVWPLVWPGLAQTRVDPEKARTQNRCSSGNPFVFPGVFPNAVAPSDPRRRAVVPKSGGKRGRSQTAHGRVCSRDATSVTHAGGCATVPPSDPGCWVCGKPRAAFCGRRVDTWRGIRRR